MNDIQQREPLVPFSIIFALVVVGGIWVYGAGLRGPITDITLEEQVIPSKGITLPIRWGDLGVRMVQAGVIDVAKLESVYAGRGGIPPDVAALIQKSDNDNVVITPQNSGAILNLLWAMGLANKNPILENGPMQDSRYGGAGRFASTGGWTLSQGDAMDHYSQHQLIVLTADQQDLVERIAKGVYRPCCDNSTYFPDCNHGMAMLGLLEIMAAQGASEKEMYKTALVVNSYWFPETYLTIARYFQERGIGWDTIDPQNILGVNYSSAQGYQRLLAEMKPTEKKSSAGCSV